MADSFLISRLVGSEIYSKNYGHGVVTDVSDKGGHYYLSASFTVNGELQNKTFQADTAFSSGTLYFDSVELTTECKNAFTTRSHAPTRTSASSITDNETIALLISNIVNDIPIALELIAIYDDTSLEMELYQEAFQKLELLMSGQRVINRQNQALIVSALSMIALKYYDGDLHSYIEKRYRESRPETEAKYTRTMIQNAVYKVLDGFRSQVHYFDPKSYVAVPLVKCCVPHYRVNDLFRISYEIYKQKLLYDEDVSDEQIKEKVTETLVALKRKDLISDADMIKGTNYLMSRYTQSCIDSGYQLTTLADITAHCIRLIISKFTKPYDSIIVEPFYLSGFESWVKAFESDVKENDRYNRNKNISQPFFKLINDRIHLVTGKFSMDDPLNPEDVNNVHIWVFSGSTRLQDILLSDPNDIVFSDEDAALGGYIINRKEIYLKASPLDYLSYSIVCGEKELYNSKSRLFRSNLFFDGKGNEIRPGTEYDGELFVVTHKSNKEEYEDRIYEVFIGDGYVISTIEVNSREVFRFDDEPYVFFRISGSKLISYPVPWAEFISVESKRYSVYNDVAILFQASCDKEDILVEIDGKRYAYGDTGPISFWVKLYSKEYDGNWAYMVRLSGLQAGHYTIRLFNAKTDKQIKDAYFKVIVDPNLWKSYLSKNDREVLYDLSGSIFPTQVISFAYGLPQLTIPCFVKNLGHGSLVIYPSSISYSIDGKVWFPSEKKFYICDTPDSQKTISICAPEDTKAFIIDETAIVKKRPLDLVPTTDSPTLFTLFISYLRTIRNKKSVKIVFEYGNKSRYFKAWYYPFILKEECQFYYDENRKAHFFKIRFDSKSRIKATIKALNSETPIVSKVISDGDSLELSDSMIAAGVGYVSVSLYGKKYGALFDPFQDEPFFTFPKYDLGRDIPKLTTWPPNIRFNQTHKTLRCSFDFSGTKTAKVVIPLDGIETPLYSQEISSGEEVFCDKIKYFHIDSFTIQLYAAIPDNPKRFQEAPFYTSRPISIQYPIDIKNLLRKSHYVFSFRLDDGELKDVDYCVFFEKLTEREEKKYLVCTMTNNKTKKEYKNIWAEILSSSGSSAEFSIQKKEGKTFSPMRLKNGKTITSIIIERWVWE